MNTSYFSLARALIILVLATGFLVWLAASCRGRGEIIALGNRMARKSLWLLLVLFGITVVSFTVIHLAPGSPIDIETTMNPLADAEAQKRLAEFYGFDKPLHIQYADWLKRIVQLDFGNSMSSDSRLVMDKIAERMPFTIWFNLITLLLTLLLAIPIGVIAARKRGGVFDRVTTLFVFIGFAIPGFWLGLLLMSLFSIELHWLPISGLNSLDYAAMPALGKALDLARHLALPIFVATVASLAGISRYMRSSVLEVLRQDYILTARAKGLPERIVLFRHALANSLLPVITLLGLSVPGLIGGSVILEQLFSLPGMGQLFYGAVMARDYPLIMGNLVIGAILTLAGNLLADFCYGLADPRIHAGINMQQAGGE